MNPTVCQTLYFLLIFFMRVVHSSGIEAIFLSCSKGMKRIFKDHGIGSVSTKKFQGFPINGWFVLSGTHRGAGKDFAEIVKHSATCQGSFHEGARVVSQRVSTIADGIAVKAPGEKTVAQILRCADDVVTVSDNEISSAILLLMERTKQIVEPSGASSLAAVLSGKVDGRDKKTVCLLSGGNIDMSFIPKIVEQGLVARHRRLKFCVRLPDTPGSLMRLLQVIADAGANIMTISHDRLAQGLTPSEILVHIACEVGGEDHGRAVMAALAAAGYRAAIEA